jgi:predicted RNase H-like HicB family nuclease
MLAKYIHDAMSKATYETLSDSSFYGEIPGFNGVYANTATLEECREELKGVLEEWISLRISQHLPLPADVVK